MLCWAAQVGARPRRILDVGCGTGWLLDQAGWLFPGAGMVGADPSAGMLADAARGTCTPVRFVRAGAERLPFADAAFDLVTSTWSVGHWSGPRAGVREVGRVVAPGGLFGFADVLPLPWRRGLAPRRRIPIWLAEAMRSAGLRILGVQTIGGFGVVTDLTVVLSTRCSIYPSAASRS